MKRLIITFCLLLASFGAYANQCILSGVTDQYTYFVAVDATDFTTRETGLATWTVYRSRNGGAAAAFTTPTINETDATNMPGVYELLLDEDMTIDSGDDVQHMTVHVTHAGMAPVTKEFCIARAKITAGETVTASSGSANTAVQSIAANAITATSIATDAITAAKIAADAIGASELATDAIGSAELASTAGTELGTAAWATTTRVLTAATNITSTGGTTVPQTGDSFARLGAPAGANHAADIAAVKSDTAATLVDTADMQPKLGTPAGASLAADLVVIDNFVDGLESAIGTPSDFGSGTSTIAANLQDLADDGTAVYNRSTDSLQAIRDQGDSAWTTGGGGACTADVGCIADGTAAAVTSTTLDMATGETFADDELIGATVVIASATLGTGQSRVILDNAATNDRLTVDAWTTTPTGTVTYRVFSTPPGSTSSPIPADVREWIGTAVATPTTAGVPEVDVTYVSGTAQTANDNGADINAILVDTAEIGAAGAGLTEAGGTGDQLTAVGWNAAWDAEVQSEATDALNAYDPPTRAELSSDVSTLATASALTTVDNEIAVIDGLIDELVRGQHTTTIATLASQTSFTLTAGSADDDAYNGWELMVTDQSTATQKAIGIVQDYTGTTRTVTLMVDPGVFTMATGDTVTLKPANANVRQINCEEVTGTGTSGTEWSGTGDGGC